MNERTICTDYMEIISGTNNKTCPVFREAVESVAKNTPEAMAKLKNFITAIEEIAAKDAVKDERISSSRGNIRKFSGYNNIKTAIDFLKKNLSGVSMLKDLTDIFDALEKYQTLYTDGYDRQVRLVILEYESCVYMLVTGLAMTIADHMDVIQTGTEIKFQKKTGNQTGIIVNTCKELAKQLRGQDHKDYLDEMLKTKEHIKKAPTKVDKDDLKKESVTFVEASVGDTFEMIDSIFDGVKRIGDFAKRGFIAIKNSIFGIVPLIRSILYLRYKRKADTVLALDQQVEFLERNIEQLKNMKTMEPKKREEIIKKQQAVIEAYKKKAAKLRAELSDGEREASEAIKKDEPKIRDTSSKSSSPSSDGGDDDFSLERAGFFTAEYWEEDDDVYED